MRPPGSAHAPLLLLMALAWSTAPTPAASAQDDPPPAPKAKAAAKNKAAQARTPADRLIAHPPQAFSPEREAAALVFVRQHHPELASLLETLKAMNEAEYRSAIVELFQVSERLTDINQADPKRYAINLDAWKAKSRVELITAQLAQAPSPTPELESQLRQAVQERIDVEVRRKKLHLEEAEATAATLRKAIADQEKGRDDAAQLQVQALLRKARKDRRPLEAKPTNAAPAKGENDR